MLEENEDERYDKYQQTQEKESIYQHCIKAIERSLNFGENGLPKIGSGDWNDGFSTVGNKGKGESVWLGFFLYNVLDRFIPICQSKNDTELIQRYEQIKANLKKALNTKGWDGRWYKRAFMDDGNILGSMENEECRIDSIAQSWSTISNAGDNDKKYISMDSLENHLIDKENGIIKLLDPPFDKSKLEPGYIKAYLPGVRENGGQYTHAATWVILAWTLLGDGNKAWKYYNMINPINHSSNKISANNYKIEPYVMAADIYLREPHGGRGGWSWYTGASGWMYKVGLENILGLKRIQNKGYKITPCVPDSWNEYEINIKDDVGEYHIVVKRKNNNIENKDRSKIEIILNNNLLDDDIIPKTPGKNEIKVFF